MFTFETCLGDSLLHKVTRLTNESAAMFLISNRCNTNLTNKQVSMFPSPMLQIVAEDILFASHKFCILSLFL